MPPNPFASTEYQKLLQKYLDDRVLEPGDFPEGLVPIAFPALLGERGYNSRLAAGRPFIFLQYKDHDGSMYFLKEDVNKENPYALARFLGDPVLWKGDEPPPKVIAQNNRPNVLHYEPIMYGPHAGKAWADLPEGTKVLHLESMVKAKAVHKWTGYPCIGLNGVDSFASSKRGVRFLYEDQEIDFSQFYNVVLFDSNVWKPAVAQARERLLFKFKHVLGGKQVGYVDLPKSVTGEDWGPDDFLRVNGNEPLTHLIETNELYDGGEHADLLKKMDRAVFCTKGGTVVDREDKHVRAVSKARDYYANINAKEVGKGGKITTIPGFSVWLESPHRTEVVNPAYEYLGTEFIDRFGDTFYNAYRPSGPWPTGSSTRGDIEPILKHLNSVMKPNDLELLRSYLKFAKFTGGKITSFPVIYSDKRGVGKGWFSKIATRFLGDANTTSADAKAFVSNFNAQIANKRLVVINEFKVTGQQAKDAAMNSLKRFFGDEDIVVEPKGVDSYKVENSAGMIITSNALEDVPTDGMEDRRMWYVECHSPDYTPDWLALHTMIDRDDVMNAVYDWVEGGQDINFSTWRPPLDMDRVKAIRRSSSGLDDACSTVLEDMNEEGCVCVRWEVLKEMLKYHVPKIEELTPKLIHNALKRTGWIVSPSKYGNTPASRRNVWVCNEKDFWDHEHDTKWVGEQLNKSAGVLGIGGDKY
jgi:Family of unknown function (DUF5906)